MLYTIRLAMHWGEVMSVQLAFVPCWAGQGARERSEEERDSDAIWCAATARCCLAWSSGSVHAVRAQRLRSAQPQGGTGLHPLEQRPAAPPHRPPWWPLCPLQGGTPQQGAERRGAGRLPPRSASWRPHTSYTTPSCTMELRGSL